MKKNVCVKIYVLRTTLDSDSTYPDLTIPGPYVSALVVLAFFKTFPKLSEGCRVT